jgi:hypothetical protein
MRRLQIVSTVLVSSVPFAAWAIPFQQSFSFATPADQAEWTVTTNNDFNGPGVPQYGVPDSTAVRIQPIDAGTKDTGDIRLYRQIDAPAGYTFSSIVFSGIGMGYSSHVTWADVLLSPDGEWGTANTDADVIRGRAASGYDEVPIAANATGNPLYTGVSTIFLQIRIVDALAVGSPASASPYARAMQVTAELTQGGGPVADSVWNITGSGDWNNVFNWLNGSPNGVDKTAKFGDKITAPQTVYTNTAVTLGSLSFDNANMYVISGAGSLTVDVSTGSGSIDVVNGTHKLNLPVTLADSTNLNTGSTSTLIIGNPLTLNGGVTLNKNGDGTLLVQAPMNAPSAAILKINGGVVNLDAANNDPDISINVDPATLNLGANQTLGTMTLSLGGNTVRVGRDSTGANAPAKLTLSRLIATGGGNNVLQQTIEGNTTKITGSLQIDANTTLMKQGPGVLSAASLNLNSTAKLDLMDGRMIVDYSGASPLASAKSLIVSGRAGGAWNGNGIQSSVAAITAQRALGYVDTSVTGAQSFGGESADATSILIGYTVMGDANLDGTVSSLDLNALIAGYGATTTGQWYRGDFNYDGKVNTLDFNHLAGNFGVTAAPSLGAIVPEPSALGLIFGVGLLLRRRSAN